MSAWGLGWLDSRNSHRIIYLHNLSGSDGSLYPNCISAERLEEILTLYLKRGYRFIRISEAIQRRMAGKSTDSTISISTDDGFAYNHSALLWILKRLSIPLTLFMIGKCLDNRALAWNHKLLIIRRSVSDVRINAYLNASKDVPETRGESVSTRLFSVSNAEKDTLTDALWEMFMPDSQDDYLNANRVFLSREQMMELSECGAEFGLHSHTHADFSRLSAAEIDRELRNNRNAMEDMGLPVQGIFAFPYGRTSPNDDIERLCRKHNLLLTLGIRYSSRDNIRLNHLWQRQSLEFAGSGWRRELLIKPYLRTCKDMIRATR